MAGEYWDFFDHYVPLTELSHRRGLVELRLWNRATGGTLSALHDGGRARAPDVDDSRLSCGSVGLAAFRKAVPGCFQETRLNVLALGPQPDTAMILISSRLGRESEIQQNRTSVISGCSTISCRLQRLT